MLNKQCGTVCKQYENSYSVAKLSLQLKTQKIGRPFTVQALQSVFF